MGPLHESQVSASSCRRTVDTQVHFNSEKVNSQDGAVTLPLGEHEAYLSHCNRRR